MKKKTVVVGMSGGVDSSVAAALLKEQGFNVIGLFMNNWNEQEGGVCSAAEDWADVRAVCGKLDIPHYAVDFADAYMQQVFSRFLTEYRAGRTPNPDVLCNREIKFGPFREYALKLGADYIATGHYCDIEDSDGLPQLHKAVDANKDQTYFLCQVRTAQLANVLFPLGKLKKEEVRAAAARLGLATAAKKDSTGICFIGERNFRQFLHNYLPLCPGPIKDRYGRTVGEHRGLAYYTLGQRRGLDIGGVKGEAGRWYVTRKDLAANVLYVSCGEGEELLSRGLRASEVNIIGAPLPSTLDCTAKFRYRQSEQQVRVRFRDDKAEVEYSTPQRAVTPGQYVVFYAGRRCLGGGVIDETF